MKLLDLIFKKESPTKEINEDDIINFKKNSSKKSSIVVNDKIANIDYSNINVYSPKNQEEIEKIVLNLKKEEASIINLKGYEKVSLLRVLDFLNGAVFALNGNINRLTQDLYLVSPQTLRIKVLKWQRNQNIYFYHYLQ